ncbi:MAG: hypothetical protein GY768_18205, partial [Planctomycetaceae bacterium]|nr:hypothetical protein [Planctomycetaceae bacterium]
DEAEVAWVAQSWADNGTFEDLATSERRYASLDFKLSTAAIDCIRATNAANILAQTVHSHETKAVSAGHCLKGRQVIHLMDQFFRTQPHMGALYSVMDLTQVTFHGDSKMADFRFAWDTILEGMPQRLEDNVLEKLLAEKLSSSTALKVDLEHYYRTEDS